MRGDGRPNPVVVGVDDTGSARAVQWAAAESATRGCRLRIVHAFRPYLAAEVGTLVPADACSIAQETAWLVLEEALAVARATAPDLEIVGHLVPGRAAPALLNEARRARLLVLGSNGRRGLTGRLHGAVAACLVARSPCPVVVVHADAADRPPVRSVPRVVVGVAPDSPAATLGFALQAAQQRGVPLVALSAWTPDAPADVETPRQAPAAAEAAAARALDQAVAVWRPRFPSVPVEPRLVCTDSVAQALVAASSGASLLVVGCGTAGRVRRMLFGSVNRAVVQRAGCAVAVVRSVPVAVPTSPEPASGAGL